MDLIIYTSALVTSELKMFKIVDTFKQVLAQWEINKNAQKIG